MAASKGGIRELGLTLLSIFTHADGEDETTEDNAAICDAAVTALAAATPANLGDDVNFPQTPSSSSFTRLVFEGSSLPEWLPGVGGGVIDVGAAVCTASSSTNQLLGPQKALEDDPREGWSAASDELSSWWQIDLGERMALAKIEIGWRICVSPLTQSVPEVFSVSYSDDASTWTRVGDEIHTDSDVSTGGLSTVLLPGAPCRYVRVDMRGFSKHFAESGDTDAAAAAGGAAPKPSSGPKPVPQLSAKRAHGISRFLVYVANVTSPRVSSASAQSDLELLFYESMLRGKTPLSVGTAMGALMQLCTSTASAKGLLLLVSALLDMHADEEGCAGVISTGQPSLQRESSAPTSSRVSKLRPAAAASESTHSTHTDKLRPAAAASRSVNAVSISEPLPPVDGPLASSAVGASSGEEQQRTSFSSSSSSNSSSDSSGSSSRKSSGFPRNNNRVRQPSSTLLTESTTGSPRNSNRVLQHPPLLSTSTSLPHTAAAVSSPNLRSTAAAPTSTSLLRPPAPSWRSSRLPFVDSSDGDDGTQSPQAPSSSSVLVNFLRKLNAGVGEALESLLRPLPPPIPHFEPRFDPTAKSSNMTINDSGTVMTTTSAAKGYVLGTIGFKRGHAAWEFKCETDQVRDECLCYGAAVKPITNAAYDASSSLFTIRGYNGRVYSGPATAGATPMCVEKMHPGDVIRFELDCDAGEVACSINGVPQGVVFTGLAGKEVFPAMCAYGSSRSAVFQRLEAYGQSSTLDASAPVDVSSLSELAQGNCALRYSSASSAAAAAAAARSRAEAATAASASLTAAGRDLDFAQQQLQLRASSAGRDHDAWPPRAQQQQQLQLRTSASPRLGSSRQSPLASPSQLQLRTSASRHSLASQRSSSPVPSPSGRKNNTGIGAGNRHSATDDDDADAVPSPQHRRQQQPAGALSSLLVMRHMRPYFPPATAAEVQLQRGGGGPPLQASTWSALTSVVSEGHYFTHGQLDDPDDHADTHAAVLGLVDYRYRPASSSGSGQLQLAAPNGGSSRSSGSLSARPGTGGGALLLRGRGAAAAGGGGGGSASGRGGGAAAEIGPSRGGGATTDQQQHSRALSTSCFAGPPSPTIVVGGIPRREGISLRVSDDGKLSPAGVTYPLTVLESQVAVGAGAAQLQLGAALGDDAPSANNSDGNGAARGATTSNTGSTNRPSFRPQPRPAAATPTSTPSPSRRRAAASTTSPAAQVEVRPESQQGQRGLGSPSSTSTPAAALATAQLQLPPLRERPFEWFLGEVGIDDSSPFPEVEAGAAHGGRRVQPVVMSVLGDGRVLWSSPLMSQPGETHAVRVFIGGVSPCSMLTLCTHAVVSESISTSTVRPLFSSFSTSSAGSTTTSQLRFSDAAAVTALVPFSVWCSASVTSTRDWSWMSTPSLHGALPPFVDSPPPIQQTLALSHVSSLASAGREGRDRAETAQTSTSPSHAAATAASNSTTRRSSSIDVIGLGRSSSSERVNAAAACGSLGSTSTSERERRGRPSTPHGHSSLRLSSTPSSDAAAANGTSHASSEAAAAGNHDISSNSSSSTSVCETPSSTSMGEATSSTSTREAAAMASGWQCSDGTEALRGVGAFAATSSSTMRLVSNLPPPSLQVTVPSLPSPLPHSMPLMQVEVPTPLSHSMEQQSHWGPLKLPSSSSSSPLMQAESAPSAPALQLAARAAEHTESAPSASTALARELRLAARAAEGRPSPRELLRLGPPRVLQLGLALPTSPLSLARAILSRISVLAEFHVELTRQGQSAVAKVCRILNTNVGSGMMASHERLLRAAEEHMKQHPAAQPQISARDHSTSTSQPQSQQQAGGRNLVPVTTHEEVSPTTTSAGSSPRGGAGGTPSRHRDAGFGATIGSSGTDSAIRARVIAAAIAEGAASVLDADAMRARHATPSLSSPAATPAAVTPAPAAASAAAAAAAAADVTTRASDSVAALQLSADAAPPLDPDFDVITPSDIRSIERMRILRRLWAIDVCGATFSLLSHILATALPHVRREASNFNLEQRGVKTEPGSSARSKLKLRPSSSTSPSSSSSPRTAAAAAIAATAVDTDTVAAAAGAAAEQRRRAFFVQTRADLASTVAATSSSSSSSGGTDMATTTISSNTAPTAAASEGSGSTSIESTGVDRGSPSGSNVLLSLEQLWTVSHVLAETVQRNKTLQNTNLQQIHEQVRAFTERVHGASAAGISEQQRADILEEFRALSQNDATLTRHNATLDQRTHATDLQLIELGQQLELMRTATTRESASAALNQSSRRSRGSAELQLGSSRGVAAEFQLGSLEHSEVAEDASAAHQILLDDGERFLPALPVVRYHVIHGDDGAEERYGGPIPSSSSAHRPHLQLQSPSALSSSAHRAATTAAAGNAYYSPNKRASAAAAAAATRSSSAAAAAADSESAAAAADSCSNFNNGAGPLPSPATRLLITHTACADAAAPWTALARLALDLIHAHLRIFAASGATPSSVGIDLSGGSGDDRAQVEVAAPSVTALSSADPSIACCITAAPPDSAVEVLSITPVASIRNRIGADVCSRGDASHSSHWCFGVPRFSLLCCGAPRAARNRERTLGPLLHLLTEIMDDGAPSRSKLKLDGGFIPSDLVSTAADVIESGLGLFYPTLSDRRNLLRSLMARGATVEVQVALPTPTPTTTGAPAEHSGKSSSSSSSGGDVAVSSSDQDASDDDDDATYGITSIRLSDHIRAANNASASNSEPAATHAHVHGAAAPVAAAVDAAMPPAFVLEMQSSGSEPSDSRATLAATPSHTSTLQTIISGLPPPLLKQYAAAFASVLELSKLLKSSTSAPVPHSPPPTISTSAASPPSVICSPQEHHRLHRALLLLQVEAERRDWDTHLTGGRGGDTVVLLLSIPPNSTVSSSSRGDATETLSSSSEAVTSSDAVDFLERVLSSTFRRSGLGEWNIPGGCSEPRIPLKIERHSNSNFGGGGPRQSPVSARTRVSQVEVAAASPVSTAASAWMASAAHNFSLPRGSRFASPTLASSNFNLGGVPGGCAGIVRIYPRGAVSFEELLLLRSANSIAK